MVLVGVGLVGTEAMPAVEGGVRLSTTGGSIVGDELNREAETTGEGVVKPDIPGRTGEVLKPAE